MKKVLCLSLAVLTICLCFIPCLNNTKNGSASSVQTSQSDVINDLTKEYSIKNRRNVTVTSGTETKLNSPNYNQTRLKNFYNAHAPADQQLGDGGICWAAATTSLLKYNGFTDSEEIVANNVIEYAYSKKWCSYSNTGLNFTVQDDLITNAFATKSISKKGNNDYYNIYSSLKSEVNNNRVVIFSIVNHAMTGCGYVTYNISYEEKNIFGKYRTKTDTKDYVICNDTWSDTRQYSYFPEDEIGTTVFTRWDFGITKIRNK